MANSVSITFPEDDYRALNAEISDRKDATNITDYCRQIILNRHEKEFTIQPLADDNHNARTALQTQLNRLTVQLEMLQEEKEKLLDRLEKARTAEGLSGVTAVKGGKEESVNALIDRKQKEWEQKLLSEKHEELKTKHKELEAQLTAKYKELEADYDVLEKEVLELRETTKMDARIAGFLPVVGEAAGTMLAKSPELAARIGDSGLSGLLWGNRSGSALPLGNMDAQSETYLRLGKAICESYGTDTNTAVDLMMYLKANPNIFRSLTAQPAFHQFIASRQAA